MIDLQEHLVSTFNLVSSGFPNGISEGEYYPLVAVLYDEMSNRVLADFLSSVFAIEYEVAMNDVLVAASKFGSNVEAKNKIINRFDPALYEMWRSEP